MGTVIYGMPSDLVRRNLEVIDDQLECEVGKVIQKTFDAIRKEHKVVAEDKLYSEARLISERAYSELKSWAEEQFTTSPEKELATAWVNGCAHRFFGPKSIQKDIRQVLSLKN